jgi:hypothetical protein
MKSTRPGEVSLITAFPDMGQLELLQDVEVGNGNI